MVPASWGRRGGAWSRVQAGGGGIGGGLYREPHPAHWALVVSMTLGLSSFLA